MHKENLALNNLQWLICYETRPNQIKCELILFYLRPTQLKVMLHVLVLPVHGEFPLSYYHKIYNM